MSDEQYARTGRVMFIIVWVIIFGGLLLFFSYHEKSESTVYLATANEYILSADKDGHYRIKGKINQYEVDFIVDTGATSVAIPQSIADTLHIVGRYPITLSTANGEVTGSLTRIQQLSFGSFTFENVKAVIMPGNDDNEVLLGMNVLSQFNIIQQDERLILKRRKHSLD